MAGAGDAAIAEIDPAVGTSAVVDEQSGRPSHMRLNPAPAPAERAVENHVRPGIQTRRPDEIHVVAGDFAAIDQDLAAFDAEVCRLGCAQVRIRVCADDVLHCDALAREHSVVHQLFAIHVAHPAIIAADTNRGVRRLAIRDLQRWTLKMQMFDTNLRDRR